MAGVEAFGVLNPNDFSDEPPQFRAANEDFHYPSIRPTKPAGAALVELGRLVLSLGQRPTKEVDAALLPGRVVHQHERGHGDGIRLIARRVRDDQAVNS